MLLVKLKADKAHEKVKMSTIFIEDGLKQVWDEERYIKEVNWI
ncbi:hypothetical protein [Clostridium botulinum]|nr:hypothetical protein [Clostridium botulinum]